MLAKTVRASMRDFCEDRTATNPVPDADVTAGAAEASFFGTGALTGAFFTGAAGSAAAGAGMLAAEATLTVGCWTALTGDPGGGSCTRAAEGGACGGSWARAGGGPMFSSVTPGTTMRPGGADGAAAGAGCGPPGEMGMSRTLRGALGSSMTRSSGAADALPGAAGAPSSPSRFRSFLSVCANPLPSANSGLDLVGPCVSLITATGPVREGKKVL